MKSLTRREVRQPTSELRGGCCLGLAEIAGAPDLIYAQAGWSQLNTSRCAAIGSYEMTLVHDIVAPLCPH